MTREVAVAVLAKAPVAGLAKTRLIPALGAEAAAALQADLTTRAVVTATAAAIGPVTLWAAPDLTHFLFADLADRYGLRLAAQPDGDLGGRMSAALAQSGGPALVIGTDCPALTPEHLHRAAAVLREGLDAVAIPVSDGGYALIGTRQHQPALFTAMAWSTPTVMAETRRRMARHGLSWREPAQLWDVDRPEDLARLARLGIVVPGS